MKILLKKCYKNIKEFVFKNMVIKRETKILDIGCGLRGNFWQFPVESYIGLDLNNDIFKELQNRTDGTYKLHDVCQGLPYADEFFDYIVSVSFFHHFNDKQAGRLISQIKRVLNQNGRAIIIDGVYPESRLNLFGNLIRYFDRGRYVRSSGRLEQLFLKEFQVEMNYSFTESIFAYTVLLLRPKND